MSPNAWAAIDASPMSCHCIWQLQTALDGVKNELWVIGSCSVDVVYSFFAEMNVDFLNRKYVRKKEMSENMFYSRSVLQQFIPVHGYKTVLVSM